MFVHGKYGWVHFDGYKEIIDKTGCRFIVTDDVLVCKMSKKEMFDENSKLIKEYIKQALKKGYVVDVLPVFQIKKVSKCKVKIGDFVTEINKD